MFIDLITSSVTRRESCWRYHVKPLFAQPQSACYSFISRQQDILLILFLLQTDFLESDLEQRILFYHLLQLTVSVSWLLTVLNSLEIRMIRHMRRRHYKEISNLTDD